ncbi:glutamine amidotransferase subunit PdxT [Vulcanibacillus modesticaldus]|uniref:Pyridoxal 5'-phosphate synthase subunit PdxT n=1 Tax=Vulcanibacillus modesticaldus TaxID=337097 RepID=A0A1D2YVF1_9BACI|nr:pyridoxal 5'-phosphate synthase glutaminase subunit PdxT [Vulcanibacillus modesticaldus]OEF99637.1 glutamine amidotransferase subunit PdxT [Vulcanibacillus modesticaldus]
MKVGVLALQGAVAEHMKIIEMAGEKAVAVKKVEQLEEIDGIIVPGGESTTIGKLMKKYGFDTALKDFSDQRKPIFGTCAGLIILAKEINGTKDSHLGLMDILVERNAFGRQRESFEVDLEIEGVADNFRAVFIRAPYIMDVKENVGILSIYNGKIVAARQEHLLASAFHPELTDDPRMHKYFIEMIREYKSQRD